jgi:hypothetical protein
VPFFSASVARLRAGGRMPSLPCFRFRDWTSHGCPTFRGVVATLASFLLPRVSLCVCVPPPTRYRLESRSRLAASKLLCKPRDTEREREREARCASLARLLWPLLLFQWPFRVRRNAMTTCCVIDLFAHHSSLATTIRSFAHCSRPRAGRSFTC